MFRIISLVVIAAGVLFAGAASLAQAAPPQRNEATVISHVTIDSEDPSVAYVRARYTCQPSDAPAHLWVSVKQSEDGTPDPDLLNEGSGFEGVAATWLQSHPTDVVCDGKSHVHVFRVDTLELSPEGDAIGYGELIRGEAYVQFCLITGDGVFIADMEFQQVK